MATRRTATAQRGASTPDTPTPSPRLDPRADRSRTTALEVARAILVEEGWDALTHLRLAERSGLHRATIYRHWPTTLALLRDVLARETALAEITPTGDLRRDLIAALTLIQHELEDRELGRVITALIDRAEWNPQINEIKVTMAREGSAMIAGLLRTAAKGGQLRRKLDPAVGVAQLLGPLLHRRLLVDEPITAGFIRTVVDDFLASHQS